VNPGRGWNEEKSYRNHPRRALPYLVSTHKEEKQMTRHDLISGIALAALMGAIDPAFAQSTAGASTSAKSPAAASSPLKCTNPPSNTLPKVCASAVPPQGTPSVDGSAGVTVNTPRSSANPSYTPPSNGKAAGTSGTTSLPDPAATSTYPGKPKS
jgi:hypothetical protein